ncbi:MAG: PhoH family protein [Nitrospirae bacterium]|nr:PhoH family protein [Nitrospirota bacterium]
MVTHTMLLEDRLDTARLFGLYDANLKAIEKALGVAIYARGQQLVIEGPDGFADDAKQVLEQLARMLLAGTKVGPDDVRYLLARLGDGAAPEAGEVLLPGLSKRLVARTLNQAHYMRAIAGNDLVVAIGPAGTGKTYLAMAAAVSAYNRKEVRRIVLTRPAVEAGERLGFLPGDLIEKVNPYLRPLYDALYDLMPGETAQRLLDRGDIEIAPLAFMRGRTLNDAFIILDEAQNTTADQMKMFLTRFGEHSKVVVTGDTTQIDLPAGEISGLKQVATLLRDMDGVVICRFSDADVIRHPLVARIIRAYAALDNKSE